MQRPRRQAFRTESFLFALAVWVLTPASGLAVEPGSALILQQCWTEDQLRGEPGDKELTELKDSRLFNREPPARRTPKDRAAPLPQALHNSIRRVRLPKGDNRIALTFDLCEMASDATGYDAGIVNFLREHRIPATFYAGGKWMRSHPEQTKQLMADPLFELGNHAWTHGNLHYLHGQDMRDQIYWTQAQYELLREELVGSACVRRLSGAESERIPRRLSSFRFPFGTCHPEALAELADAGLPAVQWDVVSGDPTRANNAKTISRRIMAKAKPGSIVIAHANGRGWHTAEALKRVVPALRKRGLEFATVTDLLAAGTPIASQSCYWERAGDADHIDRRYGGGTEKPWPFR